MTPQVRNRALRILNALAKEASRRGYSVKHAVAQPGYRYSKGDLRITVCGHDYTICVDELNDRLSHVPTAAELREKARYEWQTIPRHDSVPSGRLRLRILEGRAIRQEKFADTKTIDGRGSTRHQLDPLNQPLALPADPDYSAEALKPFMRSWSTHGPHRGFG